MRRQKKKNDIFAGQSPVYICTLKIKAACTDHRRAKKIETQYCSIPKISAAEIRELRSIDKIQINQKILKHKRKTKQKNKTQQTQQHINNLNSLYLSIY